jgi:hypothetical protein
MISVKETWIVELPSYERQLAVAVVYLLFLGPLPMNDFEREER